MKARQGVNVPDLEIDCAALTAKDIEDAEYLLQLDPPIEYMAVSFVQKGADLQELIDIMDRLEVPPERRPSICPKIEKPQALTHLDDIMSKSGSLMVARGDLGVELGPERVPFAQKLRCSCNVLPQPGPIRPCLSKKIRQRAMTHGSIAPCMLAHVTQHK